jgi:hypothetical protein
MVHCHGKDPRCPAILLSAGLVCLSLVRCHLSAPTSSTPPPCAAASECGNGQVTDHSCYSQVLCLDSLPHRWEQNLVRSQRLVLSLNVARGPICRQPHL